MSANSSEFLLEIGCEEIPARMLPAAIAFVRDYFDKALNEAGLGFEAIESQGTPRRLMAGITGLAARQPDRVEERRGPSVEKGFDADGNPTKAAQGFARGAGVDVADLERLETPKGSYLLARIQQPGRAAAEILPEIVAGLVRDLPWPKSMRWGARDIRFVRPLHRLTPLLDGALLEVAVEGVAVTDQVLGHRFMNPGPHKVAGIADYKRVLAEANVVLELERRQEIIRAKVEQLAADAGGRALITPGLLSENASLTEWPVPLLGRFDEAFLDVPAEALTTSMKSHQKYFPVVDGDGRLMPCFVLVANLEVPDPDVLVRGNQRVLRARLEDAVFYWAKDRETPLTERLESLKKVVFQARLGSLWQKSMRLTRLGTALSGAVAPDLTATVAEAGAAAKCDLVTGMVGEFPELQGIMGGYYAPGGGLDAAAAAAIASHHRPQGASDSIPADRAGLILSTADKLDTLTGCFGIGLVPSGTKDPFALRRAALGVIRMVLEGEGLRLSLREWIGAAFDGFVEYGEALDQEREAVIDALMGFFYGRLKAHLKAQDIDYDLIDAVAALGLDDLNDVVARVRALTAFKQLPSYETLVAANKRIANILGQAEGSWSGADAVDEALLKLPAEQSLFAAASGGRDKLAAMAAGGDYPGVLEMLAGWREPIDRFFDDVLVNDDDAAIRGNRLALLHGVREAFRLVAEVSVLALPGD